MHPLITKSVSIASITNILKTSNSKECLKTKKYSKALSTSKETTLFMESKIKMETNRIAEVIQALSQAKKILKMDQVPCRK
jgi:hypothetical protein